MLSDIHLDPYAESAQLEWLRQACPDDGLSTNAALLRSTMAAARQTAPDVRFVIVAGDYLAHGFQCRYQAMHPQATPDQYSDFVVETIQGIARQIKAAYPRVPVLMALGNHDSGCGNYRQEAGDRFTRKVAAIMAEIAARSADEARALKAQYAKGGYMAFEVTDRFRLLLINDTPMSRNFRTCKGAPNWPLENAQFQWLSGQLRQAQQKHHKVWVLGHIPPGIEPWGSLRHRDACQKNQPIKFMRTERLATTMASYADTVTLGIFGHTHMDELRWLAPGVPIKVLPAITPSGGNMPAFTIGNYVANTGELSDYTVFSSSSKTGSDDARWERLYNYRETYHLPSFSGAAVGFLTAQLQADTRGSDLASQAYMRVYSAGSARPRSSLLHKDETWHAYACSLSLPDDSDFLRCSCPSGGKILVQ